MEHLEELSLQGAEEAIHQLRIIEMEGVFTVVPLEEIPVQQSDRIGGHAAVKLHQLRRGIRQMLQHIQADHRVERNLTGAAEIPVHRELVRQPQRFGPLLHKRLVVGVEIHEPDMLHLGQRRRRERMGADAASEIQHLPPRRHPLEPQGVGDVVRTGEVPGRQLQQMTGADRVLVERRRILGSKRPGVQISQVVRAAGQTLLHHLQRQIQVAAQMLLHRQGVLEKGADVHIAVAAELGHGGGAPAGCNSLKSR